MEKKYKIVINDRQREFALKVLGLVQCNQDESLVRTELLEIIRHAVEDLPKRTR